MVHGPSPESDQVAAAAAASLVLNDALGPTRTVQPPSIVPVATFPAGIVMEAECILRVAR
jgi:hypothetical protein